MYTSFSVFVLFCGITLCFSNEFEFSQKMLKQQPVTLSSNNGKCLLNRVNDSSTFLMYQDNGQFEPLTKLQGSSINTNAVLSYNGDTLFMFDYVIGNNLIYKYDSSISNYTLFVENTWTHTEYLFYHISSDSTWLFAIPSLYGYVDVYKYNTSSNTFEQTQVLRQAGYNFGLTLDISVDVSTVGIISFDLIYIYNLDTDTSIWQFQESIQPPSSVSKPTFSSISFGNSNGTYLAAGSLNADYKEGAVLLYALDSTWKYVNMLVTPAISGITDLSNFGQSVCFSKDSSTIIIGALLEQYQSDWPGILYIFTNTSVPYQYNFQQFFSISQYFPQFGSITGGLGDNLHCTTLNQKVVASANGALFTGYPYYNNIDSFITLVYNQ